METVAIFEAQARLSEILAAVEHGEEFIITRHGEPIARILPYSQKQCSEATSQARRELIVRCRAARNAAPVPDFDVCAAIEEGRD